MRLALLSAGGLLLCVAAPALAAYPQSRIPAPEVVNEVKDVINQYALAVDSKNFDFSNFCSADHWYSNYAGLIATNLSVFEDGHRHTLPNDTTSQHLMDVKYVYDGDRPGEVVARTYVIASVIKHPSNETFTDYNIYDDLLRQEDGAWKIFNRTASVLFATGNPAVIGH